MAGFLPEGAGRRARRILKKLSRGPHRAFSASGNNPVMRPLRTLLIMLALLGVGCSTGGGSADPSPRSDVAAGLAGRAEGVAAALDSGRCDVAVAETRALQADLAAADLQPAVRAEALAGAARLANSIVCAPAPVPVPTTAAPAGNSEGGGTSGKKRKEQKGDDDD